MDNGGQIIIKNKNKNRLWRADKNKTKNELWQADGATAADTPVPPWPWRGGRQSVWTGSGDTGTQ